MIIIMRMMIIIIQYVLVNGQNSTETSLDFDVPQGSVLGPLLWILYPALLTGFIEKHCIFVIKFSQMIHSLDALNCLIVILT